MRGIICSITPNPALDLSGFVEALKVDEKTYVHQEVRAPGGNGINSARILNRLGVSVVASGFLGGSTGKEIELLLKGEHLRHHFIPIRESSRINITVTNQSNHKQTRLSFPGPRVDRDEKRQLFNYIKGNKELCLLILGGSLPPGFTTKDFRSLIAIAKKNNVEVVVDCPGGILSQVISSKPLLIKPNLDEFQVLTGTKVRSIFAVRAQAEKYLNKVPYICVSSVDGGALLVTPVGAYFGRIPEVRILSTVGAGDSMVGSMVAQLYKGNRSPEQILRWGLAAAAATLSESGTRLGRASHIKKLFKRTVVESVSRQRR
ncbi:1-phosphofructokinase family hexose kinase [Bdellovibrio bacteriovorus]|uniref:1-phosphofructokinase family hexose kinase n=1 Tax=Bdellovibrio TaxID=958 RepID=UPI0035A82213